MNTISRVLAIRLRKSLGKSLRKSLGGQRWLPGLASVLLLATLGGCSTLKPLVGLGKTEPTGKTAQTAKEADDAGQDAARESTPTVGPNPYLTSVEKASALSAEHQKAFQHGVAYMKAKKWPEAVKTWRALAQALPKASGVSLNLAISLVEVGDLAGAAEAAEAGIRANKDNVALYNWAGMIARRQGDFAQAEKYYQQGIARWAGHPPLFLNLGILYEIYLGKTDLAIEQYRKYQALQTEPDPKVAKWIVDLEQRLSARSP